MIKEEEKVKHLINKRANERNKQFMEEEMKIANKYIKRLQHIWPPGKQFEGV